nr:hypothetical protein [Tanacetum cinerariifolium]
MTVQDTIQLSIAEQKNHDDLEALQNFEKVKEHLAAEEIEKMVEGTENIDADEFVNSILNSQYDLNTSFFNQIKGRYGYLFGHLKTTFMSRKSFNELANHLQVIMQESLPSMVDIQVKEIRKTIVPVYFAEGLILEKKKMQAKVAQIVANAIQKEHENLRAKITSQINNTISIHIPSQIKFEGLIATNTLCRSSAIRPRNQEDHHDDAHLEGENSAKRQKISEHETYVIGESSSGQADESDPSPSISGNQEQLDYFYL